MKQNKYTDSKYFKYRVLEDDTIQIIGTKKDIPNDIIIPEIIDSKIVSSIGSYAFQNKKLKSVIIPGSVKKILKCAFAENKLEKLTLNEGLEILDYTTFIKNDLKEITIPSTVRKIGDFAFENNQLEKLTLNEGLIFIGEGAFQYNYIKEITIPKSVEYIGEKTFAYNNITYINFLGNDKDINIVEDAFWYNIDY